MQNVFGVWAALDMRRRVVVVLTTLAVAAAVLFLSRMASEPRLALLYAGLENAAAGEVVTALEAQGVAYEIRGNSILVDETQRDALRMTLATQGLPSAGASGYELLDGLSGFGTTSQMFDAAYWRAKEGELARTIVASPAIRAARVHISVPSATSFRQSSRPSASVFVTPSLGTFGAEQAKALRFLVASAVSGLNQDAVSVIDGTTGTVIGADSDLATPQADMARSDALRQSVQRLLEARVGPGNAVVEVSLESVTDRESITERRYDPDSRVAISSETEERSGSSKGQGGGNVTVASNLPDGQAGGGESSSQNNETREVVNYEVSQTQREILRQPGAIRRLTVAVLVDGTRTVNATGAEVFVPRSDQEMSDLRELVASAVGYDEARGDIITLKSLEFEPRTEEGTAPPLTGLATVDMMSLIQMAVLALVVLGLGLFVVRPILTGRNLPQPVAALGGPDAAGAGLPAMVESAGPALDGEIDTGEFNPGGSDLGSFDFGSGSSFALPALGGSDADPVARLKRLISERQEETIEILRTWMQDEKEKT